jgi:hypothetical protein
MSRPGAGEVACRSPPEADLPAPGHPAGMHGESGGIAGEGAFVPSASWCTRPACVVLVDAIGRAYRQITCGGGAGIGAPVGAVCRYRVGRWAGSVEGGSGTVSGPTPTPPVTNDSEAVVRALQGWAQSMDVTVIAADAELPVAEAVAILEQFGDCGWVACRDGCWWLTADGQRRAVEVFGPRPGPPGWLVARRLEHRHGPGGGR